MKKYKCTFVGSPGPLVDPQTNIVFPKGEIVIVDTLTPTIDAAKLDGRMLVVEVIELPGMEPIMPKKSYRVKKDKKARESPEGQEPIYDDINTKKTVEDE